MRAFPWGPAGPGGAEPLERAPAHQPPEPVPSSVNAAAIERDAFAQGFAQGERAGLEAGQRRADALLSRLEQTITELAHLKGTLSRQVERQAVELSIAVARRIVHRELALDPELMAALVRVAIDRLGGDEPITIRLHPEQYAALAARLGHALAGAAVTIVPHDRVAPGGCLVESAIGFVDAGVDAQLQELTRALLGHDDAERSPVPQSHGD